MLIMKINTKKENKKITKIYEINEKEIELLVNIYRNENYELTDEDKKTMIRPPHYNQEGDYIKGILEECISVKDDKISLTQLGKEFVSALFVEYFIVYDNKDQEVSKHLDINEAVIKSNEVKGCVKPVQCFEEELPDELQ